MSDWKNLNFWGLILIYVSPLVPGIPVDYGLAVGLGWLVLGLGLWLLFVVEEDPPEPKKEQKKREPTWLDNLLEEHVLPLSFTIAIITAYLGVAAFHTWRTWILASIGPVFGLGSLAYFEIKG